MKIMPDAQQTITAVLHSRSLHVALWVGAGGMALMVGNLCFAALLAPSDFGRLALFQAITTVSIAIAPFGLDGLAVRRALPVTSSSLWLATYSGVAVGVTVSIIAYAFYELTLMTAMLLVTASVAGAITRLCAGFEQASIRLHRAQLIAQLPYILFALVALVLAASRPVEWHVAAGAFVVGYGAAALVGLRLFQGAAYSISPTAATGQLHLDTSWRTRLSLVGIASSVMLLHQIERFIVPQTLTLADLANLGIVATVVASPYRLLQSGIGYALAPQLRAAASRHERRRLLRAELRLAVLLGGGGGALLAAFTMPLIQGLYGAKYRVTYGLVLAMILSGCVRLIYGAASAAVGALATHPQLCWFNRLGWLGLGIAGFGAVVLSPCGPAGVVLGATTGWVVRLASAYMLCRQAFSAEP